MIFLKRYRRYIIRIHYNKKNKISKSISGLLYTTALDIIGRDDLIYRNIKYSLEHCYYPRFYVDGPPSIIYNVFKHIGYPKYGYKYIVRLYEYDLGKKLEIFYSHRDKRIEKTITPVKSLYHNKI